MHVCAYTRVPIILTLRCHISMTKILVASVISRCVEMCMYVIALYAFLLYYVQTQFDEMPPCSWKVFQCILYITQLYFKKVFSCSLQIQFDKSPTGSLKEPASQTPSCSCRDLVGHTPSCSRRDFVGRTPSCPRRDLLGQTSSSSLEDPADQKVHCVFVRACILACVQDNNVSMCTQIQSDETNSHSPKDPANRKVYITKAR